MAEFAFQVLPHSFGPSAASIPEALKEVPYAAFSKQDKVGKACDWYSNKGTRYGPKYAGEPNAAFAFVQESDDFEVVEYHKAPKGNKFSRRWNNRQYWHHRRAHYNEHAHIAAQVRFNDRRWKKHFDPIRRKKKWRYYQPYTAPSKRLRKPSVQVDATWRVVEEVEFSALEEARLLAQVNEPVSTVEAGTVLPFNRDFMRVNTRGIKLLPKAAPADHSDATTSDDPIMQRLIQEAEGSEQVHVFGTDAIFAVLMAATKSVIPWDLVMERRGNVIIFDRRPSSKALNLTVDETLKEPPLEDDDNDVNQQTQLSAESMRVNRSFANEVLISDSKFEDQWLKFAEQDPFADSGKNPDEEGPARGYRYRTWTVGDIKVTARCQVDAHLAGGTKQTLVATKVMNAWEAKSIVTWRSTLDNMGSAVVASEFKSNSNKMARWLIAGLLGGIDQFVMGFVVRSKANVSHPEQLSHSLIGVNQYTTNELCRLVKVRFTSMWGILDLVVGKVSSKADGKYLLTRESNATALKIYSLPQGANLE